MPRKRVVFAESDEFREDLNELTRCADRHRSMEMGSCGGFRGAFLRMGSAKMAA